jgi:sec-independent protein translocase protein TatC
MTDTPRPLLEHLGELRNRLFWVFGVWGGFTVVALFFSGTTFRLLMQPGVDAVLEKQRTLITISPPELFFVYIKTALLAGFLISLPMTLYQAWAFISPGLYQNEKRLALPFVVSTTLLFFAGATFGHRVAFPFVFDYFMSLESDYVQNQWTMQSLFAFLSRMYLVFGIAFQLPVVMAFVTSAGIVSVDAMAGARRYAVVAIFIAAAVLTPGPDVISQLTLALPLLALFELGLLGSRLLARRRTSSALADQT